MIFIVDNGYFVPMYSLAHKELMVWFLRKGWTMNRDFFAEHTHKHGFGIRFVDEKKAVEFWTSWCPSAI